ncbi:MAG: hypothetical protein AAF502_10385 [Bacteroidota bacterium]
MKKLLFSALLMLFVGGIFANGNTPEEQARQTSDVVAEKLLLNDTEKQKVYDIYLNHHQQMAELADLKTTNPDLFVKETAALEKSTNQAFKAAVGSKLEAYRANPKQAQQHRANTPKAKN